MSNALTVNGLTANEWSGFESFVTELRENLEARRKDLAIWLGRMSSEQLAKAKELLKFTCDADSVERLAQAGRGVISIEQARLRIPARVWRAWPEPVRSQIQPGMDVEVRAKDKCEVKKIENLTPVELAQVIDVKNGLKPFEKQCHNSKPATYDKYQDAEEFDSFKIEGINILIRGRLGSVIRVPVKSLKLILK